MSARCTGEPISWLRLERFHAGQLEGAENERIASHLAGCPACAACLAKIRDDEGVALPPLALRATERKGDVVRLRPRTALVSALGALAAAAAVALVLRGAVHPGGETGSRAKGGAVAFSLVREDGVRIDGESGVYRDGDRFKALVTCPPGADVSFDVVVYDDGGATFPLDPTPSFACGNEVPLGGALRLTGRGEETVCLLWSENGMVQRGAEARGEPRSCKKLTAATEP